MLERARFPTRHACQRARWEPSCPELSILSAPISYGRRSRGSESGQAARSLSIWWASIPIKVVETGGEIVPLNDVEKFRPYWHKVWQESFTREKRRWEWDCKYYYTLHTEGGASERLETVTEEVPGAGRRIEGRLKSGLRVSVSELNALLPQISSYPALNAAQLEALSAPSPVAAFGRAARSKARFRGSEGDSVALWVYPEMRIQPVVLLRVGAPRRERACDGAGRGDGAFSHPRAGAFRRCQHGNQPVPRSVVKLMRSYENDNQANT